MKLCDENLKNKAFWEEKGFRLPRYDRAAMIEKTLADPVWLHFGAGNIFKAFPAAACQSLLDSGLTGTGIIAVDRRQKCPETNDNLTVKITLRSDGNMEKAVIGSVAERLFLFGNDSERLQKIFESPSLQMVSFTITEKGYALFDGNGDYLPDVAADLASSPENARSYMGKLAALLFARFRKNGAPLAMVSMDNCSHNGDILKAAVTCFARTWGDEGFCSWLEKSVSFPWTMIDKITPGPDASVAAMLEKEGLDPGTPFVNAEECGYLVIEDDFPNGRPCLEKAGLCFTGRETVDRAERMKVCTCLNPLHTSLAVFGCLLGYKKIWQELEDEDLRKLVEGIGYREGMPVVTDPGILRPKDFLDTVIKTRFPNPFLPDTPQRIATDTSQKLPIRFGETIKAYMASDTLDAKDLTLIPLVFAGWLRYLMAVDDSGREFALSPDPLLDTVRPYVANMKIGGQPDLSGLVPLLENGAIFGTDLVKAGLADKVLSAFAEMTAAPGAVRKALHRYVTEGSCES